MLTYIHKLSGFLFYLLGGSFFLSFMLHYNHMGSFGGWWLKVADLPLALAGVIFGGSSLYLSVKPKNKDSKALMTIIGIPLTLLFLSLIVMNFWPVFTQ
jgi:hypothetical protein